MEKSISLGGGVGGDSSSFRATSSFEKFGDRTRFTVEIRPGETIIVSWKKLVKDASKATAAVASASAPEPSVSAVIPSLESRLAPGQPAPEEFKDGTQPNRFNSVIEKIERLYMGKDSSDDEDPFEIPDDQYDTEDSFIDDAELMSTLKLISAGNIIGSWEGKTQVLFCKEARKFTFNVIVQQVLGLRADEAQTVNILEDFLTFMRGLISLPLYIPGTPYARAVQARSRISCTVKSIIDERRASTNGGGCNNNKEKKRNDFLETLLGVDTLSEDEKVSFVLDSLLGGYETTSLLMAMAVHFLGRTPLALHHLKEE